MTPRGSTPIVAHFVGTAAITGAPLVSEHISFVRAGGVEVGHLTPLPRTRAAVDVMVRNVRSVQAELDAIADAAGMPCVTAAQ